MEWYIALKKDGGLFVAYESVNGDAAGGLLNNKQAEEFKRFIFGDNFEEEIARLTRD